MNGTNMNHLFRPEQENNYAITNSNSLPNLASQQNHYSANAQASSPTQSTHSQWQHQQQQQFNQPWNNFPAQYFNTMNGMGGMGATMANGMNGIPMNMGMSNFNMPMFSQQFLHDALALSAPVVVADEPLLVSALVASRARQENYKDALNNLHGKNSHSAILWKDYYLEHKDRLDEQVSIAIKNGEVEGPRLVKTAKKPALDSFKDFDSSSPIRSSSPAGVPTKLRGHPPKASTSQSSTSRAASSSKSSTPVHDFSMAASGSRRQTINSLTVHTPVYNKRLPPPNSQVIVPEPPSRSPSPPTRIVPHVRGNRFTDEDKEFFIKFISWRLKNDASLGRNELCDELERKAPHHTSASWNSYWSNHHDLPDKILANAHARDYEEEDGDEEESGKKFVGQRPRYKDSSSEEEELSEEDEYNLSDDEDIEIPMSFDENAMGGSGSPFTDADYAIVSRHVASISDFDRATFREKWDTFHGKHPQRSAKSWAEFFRREEKRIRKLAKKIREQGLINDSKTEPAQERKITWDAPGDMNGPPKAKRKFILDDKDEVENQSKIAKVDA
ncbi:hypothetical protein VKT23_003238 [Stygiomarasmius scandens]|uniref:Uncharacterized protein n=1 Tax=Marasmiellus scandens TaxID=2682957 RepID=A0ABR1JXC0_9AGAR